MEKRTKYFNWIQYLLHGFSCIGCGTIFFLVIILGLCIGVIFVSSAFSSNVLNQSSSLSSVKNSIIQENIIHEGKSSQKIAIINIKGVITSASSGLFSAGNMMSEVSKALSYANNNSDIKEVILFIDSPGGGVVASDNIYRKVKELSKNKTVTAYISSIGASGGYYIAVGANKIVMHQAGITGSIGVIMSITNYDELYNKIGIRKKIFKSGRFKDSTELFDNKSDGQLQNMYQEMLNEVYNQFVDVVVANRPLTRAEVLRVADGRVLGTSKALKYQLIDDVGNIDEVIAQIKKDRNVDYQVVELSSQYSFFDQLMKGYSFMQQILTGNVSNSGRKLYYLYED